MRVHSRSASVVPLDARFESASTKSRRSAEPLESPISGQRRLTVPELVTQSLSLSNSGGGTAAGRSHPG